MEISADKLKDMGFVSRVDYDRDKEADNFDTLKFVTHSGKVLGWIEIEVTETFMRAEDLESAWLFDSICVELCMADSFQELPISDMEGLKALIDILTTGNTEVFCKKCSL